MTTRDLQHATLGLCTQGGLLRKLKQERARYEVELRHSVSARTGLPLSFKNLLSLAKLAAHICLTHCVSSSARHPIGEGFA